MILASVFTITSSLESELGGPSCGVARSSEDFDPKNKLASYDAPMSDGLPRFYVLSIP